MSVQSFRIGLLGAGGKLKIDNGFLDYTSPYAKHFRVSISDIETVTVDAKGFGQSILKIIGHGTALASVEMPTSWANKCQDWILENK